MFKILKDWNHLTVISIILGALLSSALCPLALADPPRTLIRNAALILTMDPTLGQGDLGVIEEADILLTGNTIVAVGKDLRGNGAQVIDATGKLVMPGFVDAHNHLWQSLIRGCGTDKDVNGWLGACVFPLFGFNFSAADVYAGVRLSTLDLINTGVTTTSIGRIPSRPPLCVAIFKPSATRDCGLSSPIGALRTQWSSTTCDSSNKP